MAKEDIKTAEHLADIIATMPKNVVATGIGNIARVQDGRILNFLDTTMTATRVTLRPEQRTDFELLQATNDMKKFREAITKGKAAAKFKPKQVSSGTLRQVTKIRRIDDEGIAQ